ncbi:MAG TPA: hypothetical protein DIC36_03355 [Gammaproteobacteria bacterium]|nr:hypothetical protein [Gammaproteobacteria bacterium]
MLVELIQRALERFPGQGKQNRIDSDGSFAEQLHEYVRAGLALERLEVEMNEQIHAVLERYIGQAQQSAEYYNDLDARLKTYAKQRRDDFLKSGTDEEDGKSVDFGVAVVKYRKNPDRVTFIPDEDAAIKELRAKGLTGFYQTQDAVLKNVVKAKWEALKDGNIKSIRLAQGKEKIYIEPKREALKGVTV